MPITTPRKVVALPPPREPSQAVLTRAEVDAMLSARDAIWSKHLEALQAAFTTALQAIPKPPPLPKRKGADVDFKYDARGFMTSAEIIPKE